MAHQPVEAGGVTAQEDSSNPLTFYLYPWVSPLFAEGWKSYKNGRVLTDEQQLRLPANEDLEIAHREFIVRWEEALKRADVARANAPTPEAAAAVEPSLFWTLMATYKRDVLIGAIGRIIADGLSVAAPFFLRELIYWMAETVITGAPVHVGFIWSVVIGLNQYIVSVANNSSIFHMQKAFCKMRTSLLIAIYEKSLKLDAAHGLTGKVAQMHSADTYKFIESAMMFHQMWSAPLVIIAALIALYYFIGWAGVMSIGIMIIFVPLMGIIAGKQLMYRAMVAGVVDKRLQGLNEALQGIRIVKFMNWEEPIFNRMLKIRNREVSMLRIIFIIRSVMNVIITFLPMLVSFAVYAIAYGMGFTMTPGAVFPASAMLNVLRMPLFMLPMGIGRFVDLGVSCARIRDFLKTPEQRSVVTRTADIDSKEAIVLDNVTVQYLLTESSPKQAPAAEITDKAAAGEQQMTERQNTNNSSFAPSFSAPPKSREVQDLMSNISLTLPRGKLTLVIGSTGSGKSTLLNAMIGEAMVADTSKITVNGSLAYLSQEAWIMNATVRDNILMGLPYDKKKYVEIVNSCQLMADLEQLPASDETEIGERGVNISGGQKQRVAFARAAYCNRDIILMDDPLSAVDAHVCLALFDECIQKTLGGRTRVLVTHQIQFLPSADFIIVVDNCRIAFAGTYDELQRSTVDVAAMIAAQSPGTPQAQAVKDEADDAASPQSQENQHAAHLVHRDDIPAPKKEELGGLIDSEHQVQGSVSSETVGWYLGIQGVVPVLLVFALFVVNRGCSVVADMMVSWWSTRTDVAGYTLYSKSNPKNQDLYLQWYGIFIGLTLVTTLGRQYMFVVCMVNACQTLHSKMLYALLHAPSSFFDTTPAGRIISRFSKDIEMIDLTIPESLNFFYTLVLVVLGAFAVMCYGAPYLSIIIVVMLVVFYFMFVYFTATNRAQKRLEATNRSPMASVLNETLGGLATIRAYAVQSDFMRKHYGAITKSARSVYNFRQTRAWFSVRVDAISSFITISTAVICCGLLISYSHTDQLTLLPIMALAVTFSMSIGGATGFLVNLAGELEAGFSSIERVKEYSDSLPQEREVVYGENGAEKPAVDWPSQGQVAFENASLRYRDGLPLVLKSITCTIQARHKIGIVGRTGSGKSTIMLALFRMVELAEGRILFDGVDIAGLTMSDLRSKITIIPQDPLLFAGTIRSNLDPFNYSSDAELWDVLDKVGIRDRVEKEGNGLQCVVVERGANFSVGQRQLLCLARALLKKCRILLLDEATASVDFESDAMIQRAIRSEFHHCTVLTIAHRLATVIDSDRVMVLQAGELKEFEHPSTLLESEGSIFHGMVKSLGEEQYAFLKLQAKEAFEKSHQH